MVCRIDLASLDLMLSEAWDEVMSEKSGNDGYSKADNGPGSDGYKLRDPGEFAKNFAQLLHEGGKVVSSLAQRPESANSGSYSSSSESGEAAKVLGAVAGQWFNQPAKLMGAHVKLAQTYTDLWAQTVRRMLGEEVEPLAEPGLGDGRFRDSDWSERQFFDFVKQAYLLTADWADEMVQDTEGLDEHTKHRAKFYVNQIASALSPSNFVLTNPEILRETLASNGENLVKGLQHLSRDLDESHDLFRVSQTDYEAFEVGKNLATTPGKVVFQNDLFQLIQYEPTTEEVHKIPLVIVPPWINKFYILDLIPEKSFIAWAVNQGFTVFVMSWVNPDQRLGHKSFEDYMKEGVLEAVEAAKTVCGTKRVNALGYCVGGTLLSATLAYMAATNDERIGSATFFTAQVDFTNAGDLLVFIDDAQLRSLEQMMAERGYLDGARMASVFNTLRPRDLIWPYVINNYLLGKKPLPFDLLYWNSDSTRMPAANHIFYLRQFYKENRLAKGEMELFGVKLDMTKVDVPVYELATREDHIAPAKSVFQGSRLFSGPVRFVLAGSGHIAGVVNPPVKKKYQYWTGKKPSSKKLPTPTLEGWLELAKEHPGSWWPDWKDWLSNNSGKMVPGRIPGEGPLKVIEDAPGSYVLVKTGKDDTVAGDKA